MNRLLITICVLIVINGCNSSQKTSKTFTEEKTMDIAYGSFPSSKMDLYLPANRNKESPFVILIHGGGWVKGDKSENRGAQQIFIENGIASVNLNYRFVDSVHTHYQQMLADIDSAVNYCIAHAKEWNTRKNNFVFMGASAGAHLALLYGYTTSKKVNAIVGQCSPTDFTDTATILYQTKIGLLPIIQNMTGAKYIAGQPMDPKYAASSPIHHIKNIPTLLIHGDNDKIVPYVQSVSLQKKLESQNIPNKLITIPGADHDMNMKDTATRNMAYKQIVDWILKYGR